MELPNSKQCSKCNAKKPLSDFYKDKSRKYGVANYCRLCASIQVKHSNLKNPNRRRISSNRYQKNNPLKVKEAHLKYNYGISLDKYNQLFIAENGNCAICNKNQSNFKKALSVDHCHDSGLVRGLLCSKCNFFIGQANENVTYLQSAINYLKIYKK